MGKLTRLLTVVGMLLVLMPVVLYAFITHKKPMVLTLKDAVFLALRDNPDLQSAELDRITQKYALVVAKNVFEPQYTLGATTSFATSQVSGQTSSHSFTTNVTPSVSIKNGYGTTFSLSMDNSATLHGDYNPTLTFQIVQPLIKGFGKAVVEAALNGALDTEKTNKLNMKNTVISTIDTVINNYLDVVQNQEKIKADNSTLKSYLHTLDNTKALIQAGRRPKNDIVQYQSQVETQRATIQSDINSFYQSKITLLNNLGLNVKTKIIIPDKINYKDFIVRLTKNKSLPSKEKCRQLALMNNVTYQADILTLQSLERSLITAEDNRRWQLDLTMTEARSSTGSTTDSGLQGIANGRNHNETVGLNLTVPIDDVSAKSSLLSARIALEKGKINNRKLKQQTENEVDQTRYSVETKQKQLEASRKALILQQKTVEFAELKHNMGMLSTFELLDQQKTLATSEQTLINNLIDYIKAIITFQEKIGVTLNRWGVKLRY